MPIDLVVGARRGAADGRRSGRAVDEGSDAIDASVGAEEGPAGVAAANGWIDVDETPGGAHDGRRAAHLHADTSAGLLTEADSDAGGANEDAGLHIAREWNGLFRRSVGENQDADVGRASIVDVRGRAGNDLGAGHGVATETGAK